MRSRPISRRAFLAGGAGMAVGLLTHGPAAALLSGHGTPGEHRREKAVSPLVLSSDLYAAPTPQRFAFAIARGSKFASFGATRVAFRAPGASRHEVYDTQLHKEGLPKGRGIYVVDAVFPVAGVWKATAIVGSEKVPFAVQVKKTAEAPRPGTPAPRAASPTTAEPLGVNPLCTRTPACPLHDVSLADVVGTGRPVAVLFATPALCQSRYCGPALDELLDVMGPYRDRVTMVHVEIYASNRATTLTPTVKAWGLPSEPWLFTIDGTGTIVERLDGAIATDETRAALDRLVA